MDIKCTYTKLVAIKDLKPNPKNPNIHSEDQIKKISYVIEMNGFRRPIVVSNRNGLMIIGHGRLEALKLMGEEFAPVDFQDYESEEQEYQDMVADNAIADWASLDLSKINTDIIALGPELNIEALGMKDFTVEPLERYDMEEVKKEDPTHKHLLQVELPNEMELRDLYDDLISKGYIVKEL